MDLALRVPCATCAVGIGKPCKWGAAPHDARIWIARSILGDVVSAAASMPSAERRRAKRAAPRPAQLDLPFDFGAAMCDSIARFEVPAGSAVQSLAAAEITEAVRVAQQASTVLERKTRKKAAP